MATKKQTKPVATKTVETKTVETKAVAAKPVAEKKAVETKVVEKKVAAKPVAEKKAAKPAAKKEIKTTVYVQHAGKETTEKAMVASVKKAWTKESGKKVGDIKTIDLYVKPEEDAVYYVVNGVDTGRVDF